MIYMFSAGCYSDYGVSGLYESDVKLDEAKLKELRIEYASSLGLDTSVISLDASLDDYILEMHYKRLVVGRNEPKYNWLQRGSGYDGYKEEENKFNADYNESGKVIKIDFIEWLKNTGIVTEVEYKEIYTDD